MASPPPTKRKRVSHFDPKWIEEFKGIGRSHKGIMINYTELLVSNFNLIQVVVVVLMSLKFNCDDCCHEVQFEPELLKTCKKATSTHLGK